MRASPEHFTPPLSNPATLTNDSVNTFTATNTTLSATTTYWLVTSNSATISNPTNRGQGFRVSVTTNTTADTGAAMGWSIGNGRFKSDITEPSWTSSSNRIIFTIKGTLGAAPVTNNAPTVANAIPDQTATPGTALSYAFPANTFADTDTGDTLTYTATKSDDAALPSWLSFAAATRTFSGTPQAADVGTVSVKVTASDGSDSVSDTFDIVVSAANNAPVFATDTASRSFTETVGDAPVDSFDPLDRAVGAVGAVVTATDADGDTLTYSLEGTDAAEFLIVSSSGQIQTDFGAKYDREAKASYSVTVKADDGNGGSDTIAVTITVDNAVEKPVAPAMPTVTATSGSTTSLDVSWTAPANTGRPAITGYKVEYRAGTSGSWINHPHTGTGTTATIASLTAATSYQVQVLAVNSDGDGPFSGPGAGTTGTATNTAPTVANAIPNQTATAGTAFSYAFLANTFNDADSDTLTYAATKSDDSALPSWLSFAAATRAFSGTPQAADVGTVSVKVTASDGNGGSVSDTFDIVVSAASNNAAMGAPTITGTAQVGETLTAVTTGITDADGLTSATYTYQWIRVNGTEADISGANSSTYTLDAADLGKTIKVKVSFTDDASNAETLTSAATATVTAAPTAPTVDDVDVTSMPASDDTYGTGEMIQFTVTFDQAVTVTGAPEFEFCLGATATMSCVGTDPPALVFSYTVLEGDVDDNGIWAGNQDRTIKLEGGTIQGTVGGLDAVLTHPEVGAKTSHKVNGAAANTAPTAADNTVTTGEDRAYTFTADDFGFMDDDAGATLASVKIVTLPGAGTLALDGTAVTADGVVTTAQIDGAMLIFTPARDAHGDAYTTFTFKVNDGTDDSASAYTMTIDVTDAPPPVCAVPDIAGAGRRQIWTGTVTVGAFDAFGTVAGYGFDEVRSAGTLLPSQSFSIGSNNYVIEAIEVTLSGDLFFSLDGSDQLTDRENVALRLHVCDGDYDFNTASASDRTDTIWNTTLDWSHPVVTRTVYLSLPANNAATGEPAITGTAQAGQELTADASPIADDDGSCRRASPTSGCGWTPTARPTRWTSPTRPPTPTP